jgi:hypothetical protein
VNDPQQNAADTAVRRSSASARRFLTLFAAATLLVSSSLYGYHWIVDRAARARTDTSFYGVFTHARGEAPRPLTTLRSREFPAVLTGINSGPFEEGATNAHLRFPSEPGYALQLRIFQSDSSGHPPRLTLALNGGPPASLQMLAGSGRAPDTTERGSPQIYVVALSDASACAENDLAIAADDGEWVALERIDVHIVTPTAARLAGLLIVLSAIVLFAFGLLAAVRTLRGVTRCASPATPAALGARVLLALAGTIVGLTMAEAALHAVDGRLPAINQLLYSSRETAALPETPEIVATLQAHRCSVAPCTLLGCGFRTNRHGFHTHDYTVEKPRGVIRIVGVGDSFMAYGGSVPHNAELFPQVEAIARAAHPDLALEFINLGIPCLGIKSQRRLIDYEVSRLSADAVVWTIYAGNDILDEANANFDHIESGSAEPASYVGRSLLMRLASHASTLAIDDPKQLVRSCRAPAEAPSDDVRACGGYERPGTSAYDAEPPTFSDASYLDYAHDHLLTMYDVTRQPTIAALTANVLQEFRALQEHRGLAGLHPFLIPDAFQLSPREVERVLAGNPSLATIRFEFDSPIRGLKRGLADLGYPLTDLSAAFVDALAREENPYQRNDSHLSASGNHLAARTIMDRLEAQGVFHGAESR